MILIRHGGCPGNSKRIFTQWSRALPQPVLARVGPEVAPGFFTAAPLNQLWEIGRTERAVANIALTSVLSSGLGAPASRRRVHKEAFAGETPALPGILQCAFSGPAR